MRETILGDHESCSVQKTFRKNTKYSRNETILKIGHFTKPIAHGKGYSLCKMVSLGQKFKIPKTCETPLSENIRVVLCKKTVPKNTKYSRNDTILKIGHLAKAIAHARAIAFAKWSVWVKY